MIDINKYGIHELNESEISSYNGGDGGLAFSLGYVISYIAREFTEAAIAAADGLGDEPVDSETGLIIGQKW